MNDTVIRAEDVSYTYPFQRKSAIRNVSFKLRRGEAMLVTGASGCGKSTLLRILNGFSPQHFKGTLTGRLEICGTDCPAPMEQISRLVAGLLKPASGTFLFDGTIRENLLLGDPFADDAKLHDALERANLGEFVRSLPGGIDTPVGERGVRISGGQAQRIAIARVFLKNPPVLILDEATSALDTFAEAAVQEALMRLSSGRTTVVIAHRLTTIRHATQICYLEDGKIVESGTHDELLAQDGRYRALLKTSERTRVSECMDAQIGSVVPAERTRCSAFGQ